jgi:hypothetical protein
VAIGAFAFPLSLLGFLVMVGFDDGLPFPEAQSQPVRDFASRFFKGEIGTKPNDDEDQSKTTTRMSTQFI